MLEWVCEEKLPPRWDFCCTQIRDKVLCSANNRRVLFSITRAKRKNELNGALAFLNLRNLQQRDGQKGSGENLAFSVYCLYCVCRLVGEKRGIVVQLELGKFLIYHSMNELE